MGRMQVSIYNLVRKCILPNIKNLVVPIPLVINRNYGIFKYKFEYLFKI